MNKARVVDTGPPMIFQVIGCAMCEGSLSEDGHVYQLSMADRVRIRYSLCKACDALQGASVKRKAREFNDTLLERLMLLWNHLSDNTVSGVARLH